MVSVLVNAYACAPNMGSEPGMGWNWVINLALYNKVYVITEGEWRDCIEEAILDLPQRDNIIFYYNPVSDKVREMCWNQGNWRFYFYYRNWQKNTYKMALEIVEKNKIDIIHQLNMIGFREPGYLWKIKNKPFIWGPIGGLKKFPEVYLKGAGWKMNLFIKIKNRINRIQINRSLRVRHALLRADMLISSIPDSYNSIKENYNLESVIIPETGCITREEGNYKKLLDNNTFKILWVGKFDFRKRLDIALHTISRLRNLKFLEFHVVGTGNMEQVLKYEQLAKDLKLQNIVIWHGQIQNEEVLKLMKESHIFFFTSLSEDTSTVVLEALNNDLPVVCFDACGFGVVIDESVGKKINFSNSKQSIEEFSKIITYLYMNKEVLKKLSDQCIVRQKKFSWENKAIHVTKLYEQVIEKFYSKK